MILHLLLFAVATFVTVTMSAFYAEADDATALKSLPKRFVRFYGACLILALLVWLLGPPT